jgi:acetylornithine deacetylase/succinyl-diaminopimelate desuccinylase-like protein
VRDGGTIGTINVMQDVLGCPVAFLDLSMPDHGYHAPNENFEWRQAARGMAAFARLVEEFAASPRP